MKVQLLYSEGERETRLDTVGRRGTKNVLEAYLGQSSFRIPLAFHQSSGCYLNTRKLFMTSKIHGNEA